VDIEDSDLVSCLIDNELCLQVAKSTHDAWPLEDEEFCDPAENGEFVNSCDNTRGVTCKDIVTPDNITFNVSYYESEMVDFVSELGGCEGLQNMMNEGGAESSEPANEFARFNL
jgi:hypothetical protein